jgi:hypothetical protein
MKTVAPALPTPALARPTGRRYLGIEEEPAAFADGRMGMRITKIYFGAPADKAGLRVGDILWSANGHPTQWYGDLAWAIANRTPTNLLELKVHSLFANIDRTVIADLTGAHL